MAKFSDVNTVVVNAVDAIFRLKEVLVAAGWVVNQSSDGTSYNAAGDNIAAYTDLDNANAWFEIQEPETNGRSWIFQRVSNEDDWYVKLSVAAEFTGGTPGITQVPSATDEYLIQGTGTDAAPNGTAMFPAPGTYRFHCIAQSTPEGPAGNRAYGFWAFSTSLGGGNVSAFIFQEPLEEGTYVPLTGTRISPTTGEADPCAYACFAGTWVAQFTTAGFSWNDNNTSQFAHVAHAFYQYGYGGELMVSWPGDNGAFHSQATNTFQQVGTGQHGFSIGNPIHLARNSGMVGTQIGEKGYTRYLKQRSPVQDYPSTLALATDAHVFLDHLLIPWPDNVAPEM